MSPDDLSQIREEIFPKMARTMFLQQIAIAILSVALFAVGWFAATKRPEVVAVTNSGVAIPLVPLDQPHVNDARIVGFADECIRDAFSHDFLNFRKSMTEASRCFTPEGSKSFTVAISPLLKDLEQRRMVMTPTLRPPVVVSTYLKAGVMTWAVSTEMTLFREGTKERVNPTKYAVDLVIERVPLEEDVRGISVSEINVRPASGGA